ncbi:MAG: hypothetical protein ACKVXR_13735 [Planctomycetota bacterium]
MLISLAVVAVAIVVTLLALTVSGPQTREGSSSESTLTSKSDPRMPLETTEGSDSARANAPEPVAPETSSPVRARMLVVSGTVIDARSRAVVQNAEIEALAKPLPGGKEARTKTQSDAQGHYWLELAIPADLAWDPQVWAVRVIARGDRFETVNERLLEADFRPHATMPNTSIAVHDLEIVLQLAWSGRLIRESDGMPIAGGTATLLALAPPRTVPRPIGDAETGSDGRFLIRMESVEPGELAMLGSAAGFLAKMIPASNPSDVGDIALSEGVCLEGFVTTANGSAPTATRIHAWTTAVGDAWMFARSGAWTVRSGALVPREAWGAIAEDGSFRLCGLATDEYSLTAAYTGCQTGSNLESLEVRAPASGLRLPLSRAVYRLQVLDARSGAAIPHSQFVFDGPQDFGCNVQPDHVIATDPGIESRGRVVAEGYRVLECLLPALEACEVRNLEFRLEPLPSQVACTIVVTSPDGIPVEEIEVEIRSAGGEIDGQGPMPRLSHLAPDGRHELPQLVPGMYLVEVEPRRDGIPSAETWLGTELELHIREGMAPVEVRLEEGGLVQATVTRSDGTPVDARTSILRTPESEPEPIDWRNEAGSFVGWVPKQSSARLDKPLHAGPWTLRFEAHGCTSQDVVVHVVAGNTTTIAVALEPKPPR